MDAQQMLVGTQDVLTVRRVFGDPVRIDGVTLIPAAVIRGGGGAGARGAEQSGAGFGLHARPAGVYVIRGGDTVSWRPAVDINRVILGGQLVAITALLTLRPVLLRWLNRRSAEGR